MIHRSRGQKAAADLLGDFSGILGSDRWGGYNKWPLSERQLCWSHLDRDFCAISERAGSKLIGEKLLAASKEMFGHWHAFRREHGDRELLCIQWQFTTDDARIKLKHLYPSYQA
uniref:Transposase IS66 central domain-containing protein n=1 Tax=Magnetococcus massalia (strain MO-1) TaxID=451514 RepID=A0A1S7LHW2_MAGMO|nr:Protein of unknown function [Candidatus Magnetococcus massalia]